MLGTSLAADSNAFALKDAFASALALSHALASASASARLTSASSSIFFAFSKTAGGALGVAAASAASFTSSASLFAFSHAFAFVSSSSGVIVAAFEASFCAAMASMSSLDMTPRDALTGTSLLQYRFAPWLTNVSMDKDTPHVTHLKQPLWYLLPSTS